VSLPAVSSPVLHVPFITWTNYVNEVATTP
jgi:hypothetical protein